MNEKIKKWARVTGTDRERMKRAAKASYEKGHSVRQIAEETGRSYGAIHRLLLDAGVTFRPRGNHRRATTLGGAR